MDGKETRKGGVGERGRMEKVDGQQKKYIHRGGKGSCSGKCDKGYNGQIGHNTVKKLVTHPKRGTRRGLKMEQTYSENADQRRRVPQ